MTAVYVVLATLAAVALALLTAPMLLEPRYFDDMDTERL